MPLSLTLLGFGGRTGRLAFLGLYILGGLAGGVILVAGILLAQSGAGVAALACKAIASIGLFWVTAVLTVRRLHDIGLPGPYAIWVLLLSNGSGFAGEVSFTLSVMLILMSCAVFAWLLLRRGEAGFNAYGPPPGTPSTGGSAVATGLGR